jgi:hypothetical protein
LAPALAQFQATAASSAARAASALRASAAATLSAGSARFGGDKGGCFGGSCGGSVSFGEAGDYVFARTHKVPVAVAKELGVEPGRKLVIAEARVLLCVFAHRRQLP